MFEKNRVKKILGTEFPIIQGGMAWVADADLAAAVSNAGGLGVIAAGSMPPELLDKEIKKIKEKTNKPFGVNIMLMSSTAEEAIEVVAENKVPVVTTGAGSPGKVINRLKPLGIKVIPVIASSTHARRVEKQGADAVIAEGMEAGGHIGDITTMVLIPVIADSVKIPVIAAGGIAESRGLIAAFALGAEGVQVGTRFAVCVESNAHNNYKMKVLRAKDRDTVVTGRPTGHPVRCIHNKLTKRFEEMERVNVPAEELEKLGAGKLKAAVVDGDIEWGSVMAGQSAALIKEVKTAREIIKEMLDGAEGVLGQIKKNLFE